MRELSATRVRGYGDSIFEEINALAHRSNAVNLGPGLPNMLLPRDVEDAFQRAVAAGHNQYSPVRGVSALRSAVADHAQRFYGQTVDPVAEVSITSGVTEAMFAALFAMIEPGDEVIVLEPVYDSYIPSIRMAGGVPVCVTLHAPSFRFDAAELRAAFSSRTRAIIVNSPHNPTGTVFSGEELACIAELCEEFDVLAITDEVYEHLVFDGERPIRLATLPGMRERTLTIGGAGKTFSCTGWRIGWAIGPAPVQSVLTKLRQFTVVSSATPQQMAVAVGLALGDNYFASLAAEYQGRRDMLLPALEACGLAPNKPAGGFFVLADISSFGYATGRDFCIELTRRAGVTPMPVDSFYVSPERGARFARFSFSARREMIAQAAERLAAARPLTI